MPSEWPTGGEALQRSFETGDRAPFAALFAPGCISWHDTDGLEVPSADAPGLDALRPLVDDLHAEIVEHEMLPAGELIRFVVRGTVRVTGRPLAAHNTMILTIGDAGITRIDEYVDPTFRAQLTGDDAP